VVARRRRPRASEKLTARGTARCAPRSCRSCRPQSRPRTRQKRRRCGMRAPRLCSSSGAAWPASAVVRSVLSAPDGRPSRRVVVRAAQQTQDHRFAAKIRDGVPRRAVGALLSVRLVLGLGRPAPATPSNSARRRGRSSSARVRPHRRRGILLRLALGAAEVARHVVLLAGVAADELVAAARQAHAVVEVLHACPADAHCLDARQPTLQPLVPHQRPRHVIRAEVPRQGLEQRQPKVAALLLPLTLRHARGAPPARRGLRASLRRRRERARRAVGGRHGACSGRDECSQMRTRSRDAART
jgi:hypothetical protein